VHVYQVRIGGRGIDLVAVVRSASWLAFVGLGRRSRCAGFYATRRVSAASLQAGIDMAKQQLLEELVKQGAISADGAAGLDLRVDEAFEVSPAIAGDPPRGFTFYERSDEADPTPTSRPSKPLRDLAFALKRLLAFALVPALVGAVAYGFWTGVRIWVGISCVVALALLWTYRRDIF
jgi:hypothetical protein